MQVNASATIRGRVILYSLDPQGNKLWEHGPFTNLITQGGFDRMLKGGTILKAIHVGTGSGVPSESDTALGSFLAGTDAYDGANSVVYNPNSPYEVTTGFKSKFAQGAVVGNVSEVGLASSAASDGTLYSRALILDNNGQPTQISVTAFDELHIVYLIDVFPMLTDATGQVVLDGVTTDYIVRPYNLGGDHKWDAILSGEFSSNTLRYHRISADAITSVTGSGPSAGSNSSSVGSYSHSQGTKTATRQVTWGTDVVISGVKSYRQTTGALSLQIGFDPAFDKTALNEFKLTLKISLANR